MTFLLFISFYTTHLLGNLRITPSKTVHNGWILIEQLIGFVEICINHLLVLRMSLRIFNINGESNLEDGKGESLRRNVLENMVGMDRLKS